jgi:hypothetical protein
MGRRSADIKALLAKCEGDLATIEVAYRSSLASQIVSTALRVEIKGFCENLRSVLDYLARDILDAHCGGKSDSKRLYFPILPDRKSFEAQASRSFPSLEKAAPDLWHYLESIQPYSGPEREWLGQLNRINNENKHEALVQQIRTSTQEVRVDTQGGGRVSWSRPGVRFGRGVSIGGVPIDPRTQLPVPSPTQTVTIIEWVDFRFEGIGVSALGLLRTSLAGITDIAKAVATRL